MNRSIILELRKLFVSALFVIFTGSGFSQLPAPALVGYWHNWNDASAPAIPLDQVDARYNVVDIAFAVPGGGTDYDMTFVPDGILPADFISQVQLLQSQGRKVIISIGGAMAPVSLDNVTEKNTFISSMTTLLNTYGFDGIDIDLEGSSVSTSGGTISAPTDAKILNLIDAIRQVQGNYFTQHGKHLLLTMAPETAFVQGGMSAYGGIWGAYLPVLDALRDSLDLLHVQLYNSGSMFGIDGNIYTQGTADFIVSMAEAVIHGFNTSGGFFNGLPASKVAIGLPACPAAAGGGYTNPATVIAAIYYLLGTGPQAGSYVLSTSGGYPDLGGMMTWSVNWDAVATCASVYEYATTFETIFPNTTGISFNEAETLVIYPNPADKFIRVDGIFQSKEAPVVQLYNSTGLLLETMKSSPALLIDISGLPSGLYLLRSGTISSRFIKH